MKKAPAFFFLMIFLIFFTIPLCAQEEDDSDDTDIPLDNDWYGELPPLYSQGDKTFNISLGVIFPTLFIQNGKVMDSKMSAVGGTGNLGFNFFLNAHFFVGGELGGQFNSTIGKNTLFIIPIGIRGGYQFLIWKMEIPISLVIGIAPQKYIAQDYAGLFIKGGVSAYYRFSPDWSFGLDFSWAWFPQWTKEPEKNADGHFINLVLSARYHF